MNSSSKKIWEKIESHVLMDLKEYLIGKYDSILFEEFHSKIENVVANYARHLPNHIRNNERDDLKNIARMEFLSALRSWDPKRCDIWPFAYTRINGAMKDHLRFLTKADPSRIYDWITSAANLYMIINHHEGFEKKIENGLTLNKAIKTLSPNEQHVVIMRYKEDLTFKEIADRMNLSESHVSRLYKDSLGKLKKILSK